MAVGDESKPREDIQLRPRVDADCIGDLGNELDAVMSFVRDEVGYLKLF